MGKGVNDRYCKILLNQMVKQDVKLHWMTQERNIYVKHVNLESWIINKYCYICGSSC